MCHGLVDAGDGFSLFVCPESRVNFAAVMQRMFRAEDRLNGTEAAKQLLEIHLFPLQLFRVVNTLILTAAAVFRAGAYGSIFCRRRGRRGKLPDRGDRIPVKSEQGPGITAGGIHPEIHLLSGARMRKAQP